MAMVMTKEWLLQRCKAQGLYRTPKLNDSLYLQCQAFSEIQNLDEYTGVTQLHLEENCIESLNGVQPLKQLQCLYLHKNFVRSIDHLEELEDLDTLDLSQNCLSKLDNLSKCSKLRVLVVSHNLLDSVASIEHITVCPSIMILDLSHNKLKDGDGVLGVAKSLANLTVLYLSGNPFVAVFPHYRKRLISVLDKLNHLDDRPVFWDERRYAEAWMRGGQEEESRERDRVREMRATEETLQFEAMRQLRYEAMEERQYDSHRPMLQFTPEELGEDVESLGSPPLVDIDQPSIRKIQDQDGETGQIKDTGLRTLPFPSATVGESWTEGDDPGQERGGCSTSYLQAEADNSMEYDLMVAQDQCRQWTATCSMDRDSLLAHDTNQQWETSTEHDLMPAQDLNQLCEAGFSLERDSMVAQHQDKQCDTQRSHERSCPFYSLVEKECQCSSQSTERKHAEFSTKSPKLEPNSMQYEQMVHRENKTWPVASTSMLRDLGTICFPAWESRSQVMSGVPVENTTLGNNNPHEVKPSSNTRQRCDPTDKQRVSSPPPQELGNDWFEWNRYYDNPSFCGGQQCNDNFLRSLQETNHTEPICNTGKLNNSSFCGQEIDDNFLLSMHRINDIDPSCNIGTFSVKFSDSNEHERDTETVC